MRFVDEEPYERHFLAALLSSDEVLHRTLDGFVLFDFSCVHAFCEELLADHAYDEASYALASRCVRIAADVEYGDPPRYGEIPYRRSVFREQSPSTCGFEQVFGEHLEVVWCVDGSDALEDAFEVRLLIRDAVYVCSCF